MTEGVVIKGVDGRYTVAAPQGTVICSARGLFRIKGVPPIPGDRVRIDGETITEVLERGNELPRPRVANVDRIVAVLAAERPAPDYALLDNTLLRAEYEGIVVAVCVNKVDLSREAAGYVRSVYARAGYAVFAVSAETGEGLAELAGFMAGKTTVLAGASGVGKSSLVARLAPGAAPAVGGLSEMKGRGRHTTRHTELFPLDGGGFVIDSPGFSTLDAPRVPANERARLFREFLPYIGACRFSDCAHRAEEGCAVKPQVGVTIDPRRYEHFFRGN
jgi:ribosome biogenesis GTPase